MLVIPTEGQVSFILTGRRTFRDAGGKRGEGMEGTWSDIYCMCALKGVGLVCVTEGYHKTHGHGFERWYHLLNLINIVMLSRPRCYTCDSRVRRGIISCVCTQSSSTLSYLT